MVAIEDDYISILIDIVVHATDAWHR